MCIVSFLNYAQIQIVGQCKNISFGLHDHAGEVFSSEDKGLLTLQLTCTIIQNALKFIKAT